MWNKRFCTFVLSGVLLYSAQIKGTTYIVTSNADSGVESLRDAITQLNVNAPGTRNTIVINNSVTSITLASDLPVIQKGVTITSGGSTIINGNGNQYRIFATFAPVTVQNCTLQQGGVGGNATSKGRIFNR